MTWLFVLISTHMKPDQSLHSIFNMIPIPPIPVFYYFGYIVSDPMEFRDGMCMLGFVVVNMIMFADSLLRGYMNFTSQAYIPMILYLVSIPIQVSIFVPENWPGAKTFRPHLLRPEEEVEAERNDFVRKYRVPV